jgi:hypothetical protein
MKTELMAMALFTGLLGGCATTPHVAPIDRTSPVAFVVVMSQPARSTATVHNTSVGHDAASGALTGATAGALSGLFCGPFLLFCVPAGALMGAGAGVAAGATVGLAESLPKDRVAQLDERLKRLQQSVDPVLELHTHVIDRAGKHWELTDDTTGKVVTLEVQNLSLTADRNKNISLVMQVLVSQRIGTSGTTAKPATPQRFSVVTKANSLAAWLEESSDLPEAQLRTACEQMATDVISQLAF